MSHIIIIPNRIDTNLFQRPDHDEINAFLEIYNLHDKKIVLFLPVVCQHKGIFDLINGLNSVSIANAHLLIVGTSPDINKAQLLTENTGISKRVKFSWKLLFKELRPSYSLASVYVLPLFFEGVPTTIFEALVMGVPVIATRVLGVENMFSKYADLVEPENPVELARAIQFVLTNGYTRCI